MSIGKPKTVAMDTSTKDVDEKSVYHRKDTDSMDAVELIADAEANIKANAGKDGLTPQAKRVLQKLATARQLLGSKQSKPAKE